eukprot:GFKZ01008646.1.p1 GENE.GFKZ01008646.1~~GFKZ01008646.1.p1  ORF type:complete len:639 (+),score=70.32 GFKZ01008646.1:165-2081(+)
MPGPLIHVLYGTVTGNAEVIARRIYDELPTLSLPQGSMLCLADYAKLPCFSPGGGRAYIVVVVSTTGDGDPPETIRPFMRLLRKKEPGLLKQLSFTVLALGDTNYENFCATGKRVDSALAKLGAERFFRRGDADDGTGLEIVVEPWLSALWIELERRIGAEPEIDGCLRTDEETTLDIEAKGSDIPLGDIVRAVTVQELGFEESRLPKVYPPKLTASILDGSVAEFVPERSLSKSFIPEIVREANVTGAKLLTAVDADKEVWHMEVTCVEGQEIQRTYRPGDAFGVIVENDKDEVDRFLKAIGAVGDNVLKVERSNGTVQTGTVRQFVAQAVDLRAVPKKQLLRCMSDHCTDTSDRKALLHLCSRDGRKQYTEEISKDNKSILEVLEEKAKSCRAPVSLFLDQLPPIAPRWYSATSSPELDGNNVLQFAFSVVEQGLATSAMAKDCRRFLDGGSVNPLLLIPRDSDSVSHFRPPQSLETDYIMIGPGTGVAPFRGFLRERQAHMQNKTIQSESHQGKTVLFFGCRHEDKDFLYRDDLEDLEASGPLSILDVAFSRAGPKKVYVQDRLLYRAGEVADIVNNGGHIYVCGDGGGMARGVHSALTKILVEHCCAGNLEEGKALLQNLADTHRYVRDIWYHG